MFDEWSNLNGAVFEYAHLNKAIFYRSHLNGTNFRRAHLDCVQFVQSSLDRANFTELHLNEVVFSNVYLNGADFSNVWINGDTTIIECSIDKKTDFRNVGLDSIRIDAGIKESLKYNRRKKNWNDWILKKWWCLLRWPMWLFWQVSDYGSSMVRIGLVFLIFSMLFAGIYLYGVKSGVPCEACNGEQIGYVENLVVDFDKLHNDGLDGKLWLRAFYFSIVTMTTLGFGDMCAHKCSVAGYWILIVQVILGYCLLGALITRLGIMFTADGPIARKGTMRNEERKAMAKREEKYQEQRKKD
jgi:hypothetical protein